MWIYYAFIQKFTIYAFECVLREYETYGFALWIIFQPFLNHPKPDWHDGQSWIVQEKQQTWNVTSIWFFLLQLIESDLVFWNRSI